MKIGLVYSFDDSDWFSVNKIVKNLLAAYQSAFQEAQFEHINYSVKLTNEENQKNMKEALAKGVEQVVFLDHRPHPLRALDWLNSDGSALKEIIIHVFGDFTLTLGDWKRTSAYLKGRKVKFVCASDKQVGLIRKFCKQAEIVYKCPFPVDAKAFQAEFEQRVLLRAELGIAEDDFIFLYAGRLSFQKNIKELVETFLSLKASGELQARHKLLLAGEFDQIGQAYLQQPQVLGEYFRMVQRVIEQYPQKYQKDVVYLGNVPNRELVHYYNASDAYVSLSTYHDEDYGMAVGEALCSGSPALLSDWAGFSSFRVNDKNYDPQFIPVSLGERRVSLDLELVRDKLIAFGNEQYDPAQREKRAAAFKDILSIDACAKMIQDIFKEEVAPFQGYTDLMSQLGAIAVFRYHLFMNESSKCFNDFYYEVYDVYAQ